MIRTLVDSIPKFNEATKNLLRYNRYTVDLETEGLEVWKEDRLCGIAIYTGGNCCSYYFPYRHKQGYNLPLETLDYLKEFVFKPYKEYVGFNYKFDMEFLHKEGFSLPNNIDDPSLAFHLLDENKKDNRGLKALATHFIGPQANIDEQKLNAILSKHDLGKGDMHKLPAELVADYAMADVELTNQLHEIFYKKLETWKLLDVYRSFCDFAIAITAMEINGMHINPDTVKSLQEQSLLEAEQHKQHLLDITGNPYFNPNSPKQVCELLGIKSSAVKVLETISTSRASSPRRKDVVDTILAFRKVNKLITTYYPSYLYHIDENSLVHANLRLTGTVTGRLSCGRVDPKTPGINLQAIPRGSNEQDIKTRSIFTSREGHYFMEADYSQAELRMLAHLTKDQNMIDMFQSDTDFHTQTANTLNIDRNIAKTINFGIVYGMGANSLAERLGLTLPEAQKYLNIYHRQRPLIKKYSKFCETIALRQNFIRLWSGRIRHIDSNFHKAMMACVQGGAAEVIRYATTELYKQLKDTDILMTMSIHDAITFEIPEYHGHEPIPDIIDIMENTTELRCPFTVDIKAGQNWGEALMLEKKQFTKTT